MNKPSDKAMQVARDFMIAMSITDNIDPFKAREELAKNIDAAIADAVREITDELVGLFNTVDGLPVSKELKECRGEVATLIIDTVSAHRAKYGEKDHE